MAEAKAVKSFSCPVCHEDLKEPKILPCTHLVCRQCLLSTLKKKRRSGKSGCPVCQSPLFKTDTLDQDDFDLFVDELPTDHVTGVKVECQKTLTGSSICTICDNSSEAESFCFECNTKLCRSCAKVHSKLPSTSNHTVEKLISLTAEQLAVKKWIPCCSHKEKSAKLYCSDHKELVCSSCATSNHRKCDGIEKITSAAESKRQEMGEQKKRLTDKEASLSAQIEDCDSQVTEAEAKFAEMRDRVITVFSDLIKSLEDKKQKLLGEIRQKEQIFLDEKLANKKELEAVRSSAEAHVNSVDMLLSSASDQALFATYGRLNPRLNEVESAEAVTDDAATIGDVYFDEKMLSGLKKTAAVCGEVRDSRPQQDKSRLIHCYTCNAISVTEGTFQFVIEKPERGSPDLMSQPCIIRNMPW
ncbi:transcription intermediary factor 1-beta-like [Littorina saxatilis]|uniref:Uncharacterized protein n=1 Tax=Littorina saxatilis TaxID=31220 RepID=A0AAN9B523_9CAEN